MMRWLLLAGLTVVGGFFALLALWMLLWSPMISERDDILILHLIGSPSVLLALLASLATRWVGGRRLSLVLLWVVTAGAVVAFIGGLEGVLDFITLGTKRYAGHMGNDYTSAHLASIAVVPCLLTASAWCCWRRMDRRSEPGHGGGAI